MPLNPDDPTLQTAMQQDADQAIAQQLGFRQQPANPFQPPQRTIASPNLLADNTPQPGQPLVSSADLSQLYGYKDLGPAAPPATAPAPAGQTDQSLGALQSALGGLGDAGGHVAASKTGAVPTGNVQLSAPQQVQAPPGPDMSKVVTAGPGAGQVPGSGTPQPQVQNVPASWTDTLSPGEREEFEAGHQRQLAGVDTEAQTQGAAADEIAGIKGNAVKELGGFADQQAEVQRQRDGVLQHYEELGARRKALADEKIDPDHWQKAGGAGRKVGMAIAMALGAFGASMTHTQNTAAEIINKHIDEQTRADEGALANKKEGVRDEMNLVEHKTALLGDKEKGIAAAKQQRLGDVLAEIDATAAKYQRPEITARAEQLKGELMQQYAMHDKSVNVFTPAHQVVKGGPAAGAVSDVKPEEVIRTHDGRYVTVPEKDREKVIASVNKAQDVHAAHDQITNLLKVPVLQRGVGWARDFDAAQKTMAAAEIESGGKGGKGIFEAFQKAQGGRLVTLTPGVQRAIDQIDHHVKTEAQLAVDNSAQFVVEPQLHANPKTGVVERKYSIKGEYQRKPPAEAGGGLTVGTKVGGGQ